MSKLFDYWMRLSLRVILLFATAMLVSFSPPYLRDFFQDSVSEHKWGFDNGYDWGFRHYLYFWMCVILFLIQAIRIFTWIVENDDKFKA